MNRFHWFAVILSMMFIVPSVTLAVTDNADNLIVGAGETYTLGGVHTYNVSVQVANTGILYVATYTGAANTGYLELHAPMITVAGAINGNGLGYRTAEGPGAGSYPGGGGGYGGAGGASGWGNAGGAAYGTANGRDNQMGSGGASQTGGVGGSGGASISLCATTLTISGSITTNGNQGTDYTGWGDGGGGGAGGGIYTNSTSTTISGTLYANGGRGGNASQTTRKGGGGGGGGRIKIFYCTLNNTGTLTVTGGAAGTGPGGNGQPGSAGTTYTHLVSEPTVTAITDVGNDQGRQVRITWAASCGDNASGNPQVTHYTIWRKIDLLLVAKNEAERGLRLSYPPGNWDFVAEVPARGEASYNTVVPTLADSNSSGMHRTTFFVSGVTANPFVYYDSPPDSGYSVDNLAPAPPGNFASINSGGANHLTWDESPETDFQYYALYRGTTEDFVPGPSNLVVEQSTTGYVDTAPAMSYYKLAAIDFNGNVSEYALASPDMSGVPGNNASSLSLRVTSPASGKVTISFVLPTNQTAKLNLYDVTGRLVEGREVSSRGQHTADLELTAGIYFVRLTQGVNAKVARVVVIQ